MTREPAVPAESFDRSPAREGRSLVSRSVRTSGTVGAARTLSNAMPICRIHVAPQDAAPQPVKVRLSDYIVTRRIPPRASNDNRRMRRTLAWQWAVGLAVVPTLAAVLVFAGLF